MAADVAPELNRVMSHDFADIVGPLKRISHLRKFTLSVVANRETAADLNKWKTLMLRPQIGMNAQSIRRRSIREAEWNARAQTRKCLLQPRWRCWTGVLYRRGKGRVLERALRFTVVIEAELVHGCVADGPGMTDVPLLKPLVSDGAEAWHIGTRRLELREWGD